MRTLAKYLLLFSALYCVIAFFRPGCKVAVPLAAMSYAGYLLVEESQREV